MKSLLLTLLLVLTNLVYSQTAYEKAMNGAMHQWENAQNPEELGAVANQFDRIAAKDTQKWEPRYYAILVRTINCFMLPKEAAFTSLDKLEMDFIKLQELIDNDETKVLKGLMQTVKVAKDPMQYGPTLSEEIMRLYREALKENPSNPRAMFQLAEYEMGGAEFWGKDPKSFCPKIEKSIQLFKEENPEGYAPSWGLKRAEEVFAEKCGD